MWKRISRLIQSYQDETSHQEEDAQQIFRMAIAQVEEGIRKNSTIWENIKQNKEELYQKIQQLHIAISREEYALQDAMRSKNKALATSHILQKESLEKQVKEFEMLHQKVLQTFQQIDTQRQKLLLQQQELKTKEVLLVNKLANAQNQRELQICLDELEVSHHIDLFEDKVNQAQIEVELIGGVLDIDSQLTSLDIHSVQDIEQHIQPNPSNLDRKFDAYQQAEQQKVRDKQKKRIEQLFSLNENKSQVQKKQERDKLEEQKKQLLQQFGQTQAPKNDKTKLVTDFFANEQPKTTPTDKKDILTNFFAENTEPKPQQEEKLSKEEQLKRFFGKD